MLLEKGNKLVCADAACGYKTEKAPGLAEKTAQEEKRSNA